jgi:hypothetical protein
VAKLKSAKTYNSGDSLVVTDPTTNPPVSGLTMGERTGSRIFHYLWSYVPAELFSQAILKCCEPWHSVQSAPVNIDVESALVSNMNNSDHTRKDFHISINNQGVFDSCSIVIHSVNSLTKNRSKLKIRKTVVVHAIQSASNWQQARHHIKRQLKS